MALKKTRRSRKMTMRRKFQLYGPKRVMRVGRQVSNSTHHFRRGGGAFSVQGNAVSPYYNSYQTLFSNITSSGEFAALYDQYRINFVVLKVWLRLDPGAQAAASAIVPRFWWVRDTDDSNAPSSLNELREHHDCKIKALSPYKPIVIKFRPNVLDLAYRGPVTSTYTPRFKQWIDMATTDVPHYGIKFAIENFTTTNYWVDIEATHYFSCKGVR